MNITITMLLAECFDFINHCLGLDDFEDPPSRTHPLESITVEQPPAIPLPKKEDCYVDDFIDVV